MKFTDDDLKKIYRSILVTMVPLLWDPTYTNAKAREYCNKALEPFGLTNETFFAELAERDPELVRVCPFWPPDKDELN